MEYFNICVNYINFLIVESLEETNYPVTLDVTLLYPPHTADSLFLPAYRRFLGRRRFDLGQQIAGRLLIGARYRRCFGQRGFGFGHPVRFAVGIPQTVERHL